MKKLIIFFPVLLVLLTACPRKEVDKDDNKIPVVSQFVYDGMSAYYLWADSMLYKEPTTSTKDPSSYFKTLLSTIDTRQGWSWITDDVEALMAGFSGTPKDFGWSLALYRVSGTSNDVVALVKYVFPNTPASNLGVVRGEIISRVDGANLTTSNYAKLFGNNALSVGIINPYTSASRTLSLTPVVIETNPVFLDTVYKDKPQFGGKKIGYLFYTDFIDDFNGKLYEAFGRFKSAGVTDLVLDLRYNHGGDIGAASYLASMIAPASIVQSRPVFTTLTYNKFLNAYFDAQPSGRPKAYFVNSGAQNPLNANLNLNTVYIIATDDSYSASELITFCLKPYMNVVHIGNNTGGKFTGSYTLHAYNNYGGEVVTIYNKNDLSATDQVTLKNWAMQPIVLKYSDKDGKDFEKPGYLAPNYPMDVAGVESDPTLWKPIGTTTDYLLAKAISLITGLPVQSAVIAKNNGTVPRSAYGKAKLFSPKDNITKGSVRFTPPQDKDFGKLLLNQIKKKQILE